MTERRQKGEVVMFQTDKSSRMAADTASNYIKSMETHIQKDTVISNKELADIERLMNAHSVCWLRMLKAGEHTEDHYRIKMSMQSHNSSASCLYALRKDHKPDVNQAGRITEQKNTKQGL